MKKGLTCQDMCEYILKAFPDLATTPGGVYNISPTGELYPVVELYWMAKAHNGYEMTINERGDIKWQLNRKG